MKNFLKHILVSALAQPPFTNLGNWFFGQRIPIFMVHRMAVEGQPFTGITPDHLHHCLQYLHNKGFHFVSLEEIFQLILKQRPLPEKAVAFTIDDGFWDQAEIAAPIFVEFNCPATIFVITGMLDNDLWPWDTKVAHLINNTKKNEIECSLAGERFILPVASEQERQEARNTLRDAIKGMAADDIEHALELLVQATGVAIPESAPTYSRPMKWETARKLEKHGIKFAPHTISHRILSKLDATSAKNEILGSWQRIQEELSSPSPVFAYPTGRFVDFGPREVNILKEAGFIGAVSTTPEPVTAHSPNPNYAYTLPRLSLPSNITDLKKYCSWIEHTRK